jgi:hypothetical protein
VEVVAGACIPPEFEHACARTHTTRNIQRNDRIVHADTHIAGVVLHHHGNSAEGGSPKPKKLKIVRSCTGVTLTSLHSLNHRE